MVPGEEKKKILNLKTPMLVMRTPHPATSHFDSAVPRINVQKSHTLHIVRRHFRRIIHISLFLVRR